MLMQLRGMEQPSRALGDLGYQFFKSRIVAVLFGRQLGNIGIVLSRKLQQRLELPAVRFDLPIARFDLPIARFNLPVARFRTANQRFQAIVKIHAQIIPLLPELRIWHSYGAIFNICLRRGGLRYRAAFPARLL
jgi:hypothetical protein